MSKDIIFEAKIVVKNQKYTLQNNDNLIKIIKILEEDLKEKSAKEKGRVNDLRIVF